VWSGAAEAGVTASWHTSLLCLALGWAADAFAVELTLADVAGLPSERASLADLEHPAIAYSSKPPNDVVARLNRRLAAGEVELAFTTGQGYLPAVLDALGVARSSQLLVFSKTSLQRRYINATTPRAIYFNEAVAVAFIPGAPLLELAALDPEQGVIFYILEQRTTAQPSATRQESCLSCHLSRNSMDVPGLLVRSVPAAANGRSFPRLGNSVIDHRSPLAERWGGWYVTGSTPSVEHLGNRFVDPVNAELAPAAAPLQSLSGQLEVQSYPGAFSDMAAHLVFHHQMHMSNLLVRVGWEARVALAQDPAAARTVTRELLANNARELVDYLLFVDEVPLPAKLVTSGPFAAAFAARGPSDRQGRSFMQFDLETRLLRYSCSYMIYAPAFDGLPAAAKQVIYRRMWTILSGKDRGPRYRKLAATERRVILEILRATKPDLPGYFH
jgi:hypothetical protein